MGRWNVYEEYSSGAFMRILIRDIRRDEEGVASTVGTIMALLVFLTFLSLIVNQYVPVWMKDSEASHMNGALGQFGGIKGAIDLQILAAQAAQISGTHYIPVTASSAVSLGVDGVPIFAASTLGTLQSFPDGGREHAGVRLRPAGLPGIPRQRGDLGQPHLAVRPLLVPVPQPNPGGRAQSWRELLPVAALPVAARHLVHRENRRGRDLQGLRELQSSRADVHDAPRDSQLGAARPEFLPPAARPGPGRRGRYEFERPVLG